jgi:hypothetical protein
MSRFMPVLEASTAPNDFAREGMNSLFIITA